MKWRRKSLRSVEANKFCQTSVQSALEKIKKTETKLIEIVTCQFARMLSSFAGRSVQKLASELVN